ncbi:amidase family protein [Algibacter mikhailovii]|uniref:Amidase n=1 Tax=Algibacter mikhailovii TaxID=425498 RepID=A0A918R2A2_9FLAO|nr:amidase family protein [Algibacter mikhailovii]GGZ81186.1 amidase [Algibacter mikhailovii]
MRDMLLLLCFTMLIACKNTEAEKVNTEGSKNASKDLREFRVLDSKNITKKEIWLTISPLLEDFGEADYLRLESYILDKEISDLQKFRAENKFTYEELVKFYLYRIRRFDRENPLSLNAVIAIDPTAIDEARLRDREYLNKKLKHPIHGMPILLKDNINAENMATTAGAVALKYNITSNAFITTKLKSKGAIILGKANLSEWANFFCEGCPNGYSAMGGQTLNPYGRRVLDTGGSSSGSAVSVAANFCAAAIGSETSGSILSPASQNSSVGLKPTIGLVSRSGIIPISSTLDTAGPITKTVTDNAIVLDAIYGFDPLDSKSIDFKNIQTYYSHLSPQFIARKRFGAPKALFSDALYANAIEVLKKLGAEIVEIEEQKLELPHFISLLNLDMKNDLPKYLETYANKDLTLKTVSDVIEFNLKDSIKKMPYGQKRFIGIINDPGDNQYLTQLKDTLKTIGRLFFDGPMTNHKLDGFLSINNFHAAYAAVAEYPAITVPMGYTDVGEPKGLTFIGRPLTEYELLQYAYAYEQTALKRIGPKNYY